MRHDATILLLIVAACVAGCNARRPVEARANGVAEPLVSAERVAAGQRAAFAGVWQACEGATHPDECSRYVLLQRGDRLCGTWSYIATGRGYDGRLIGRVESPTEARRTHVCGRPGSESSIECDDGWQQISKPLQLCDRKLVDLVDLVDLVGPGVACSGVYKRKRRAAAELQALAGQPWMVACLAGRIEVWPSAALDEAWEIDLRQAAAVSNSRGSSRITTTCRSSGAGGRDDDASNRASRDAGSNHATCTD